MKENIVQQKSFSFAVRIIRLNTFLRKDKDEYVISKQILRSGTAIGALIYEAEFAESSSDFIHKMHIAAKEANETSYWLLLLKETEFISNKEFESIYNDLIELRKLLVSIIKSSKAKKYGPK